MGLSLWIENLLKIKGQKGFKPHTDNMSYIGHILS